MLHESQLLHCLHDIQEVTSCIHAPFMLLENVLMLALLLMSPGIVSQDACANLIVD